MGTVNLRIEPNRWLRTRTVNRTELLETRTEPQRDQNGK